MRRIAFYGKGGIGKSTIASNMSLLFQMSGRQVLQVGADPKHDSAQRHVEVEEVITAMDIFAERTVGDPEDIFEKAIMIGRKGVHCIEAGGPEPGTGCAGRSISLLLELFDLKKEILEDYQVIIYDVLGDVVCGGFATPIRMGHAEELYIVTSGELMSLYAANNILKGFLNLASSGAEIAGLVVNQRGMKKENEIIEDFAAEIGVPIIGSLPRDETHLLAELKGGTIMEFFPDSKAAQAYRELYKKIDGRLVPPASNPHAMDNKKWGAFSRKMLKRLSMDI